MSAPPLLDAIVLAGGLGTRLQSVVSDRPKPMASVAGLPFLDLILHQLARSQIVRSVTLAVGHKAEFVRDAYAAGTQFGLPVRLAIEPRPLGTAGGMVNALPLTTSDNLLVLNGDSYMEVDLASLYRAHRANDAVATLTITETKTPERYGTVVCDPDGRIKRFQEKNAAATASAFINAGVYVIQRGVLENLAPRRPLSIELDVLPELLSEPVYAHVAFGRFIDIGIPETYSAAGIFLQDLIEAASRGV